MKLNKLIKSTYKQILLVIVAFAAMVSFSSLYAGNIVQKQMLYCGEETMNAIATKANDILKNAEMLLENAAYVTETMMMNGAADEEILAFYYDWSDSVASASKEFVSVGVVRNGHAIDGLRGRVLPDDYDPSTRPWYAGALEKEGGIYYTEPYPDIIRDEIVITMSKCLYGGHSDLPCIMIIDIDVQEMARQIENLQLMESGHGVLLDEEYKYIVHKHDYFAEEERTEEHVAPYAQRLMEKSSLSAERVVACDGSDSVAFYRKLDNGWYVGVIVPVSNYYSDVWGMAVTLAVLGFVLMSVLAWLLVMFAVGKLRADEASEVKTSFLANMSHEIRTPLNSITGMSELILREKPENPAILGYASEIKQAGSHLLSIINDILDISKIEAGRLELTPAEYELPSVINDVVSIVKARLDSTQVEFIVDIAPDLPFKLVGDDMRVKQILLNLLSNAVKYTRAGFIRLSIGGVMEGRKAALKLEVADSGAGIRKEDLENLFKQFERVDTKRNRSIEGAGLGLPIVKNLCEMMNGRIEVSSEYGIGSIFTAYIEQEISSYIPVVHIENAESIRVIVLEPSKRVLDSIARAVDGMGVECDAFSQVEAFLENVSRTRYNFAFVPFEVRDDPVMQEIAGDAAVVFITEFNQTAPDRNALILRKPVTSLQIGNIIQNKTNLPSYRQNAETYINFTAPKARILIVDDNLTNLKVAAGLMSPYRMQVDTASSGREAIEKIKNISNYDLVFMDHMMPDMDGIETTAEIRGLSGDYYKKLPVIALTANAVKGAKQLFIENGMNDFLAKPIDTKKLNAILKKYISKEKKIREAITPTAEAGRPDLVIDGVNTAKGIENCGGTLEGYLSVLSIFHTDGLSKLSVLRDMLLNPADIKAFTTLIHALKSACASVGALTVSGLAEELEDAGMKGDADFISNHLGGFIQHFEALLNNVHPFVDQRSNREEAAPKGGYDFLREKLRVLEDALKISDSISVDAILEELSGYGWDERTARMLSEVKKCAELFDFDGGLRILYGKLT